MLALDKNKELVIAWSEAADSLDSAKMHLEEEDVPEAENVVEDAVENIKESPFQDDRVIADTKDELQEVLEVLEQPITEEVFNRLDVLTESLREPANQLLTQAIESNVTGTSGAPGPTETEESESTGPKEPDAGMMSAPKIWLTVLLGMMMMVIG